MNEIVLRPRKNPLLVLCGVSSFDSFVSHIILDLVSFLLPETNIKNIHVKDLPKQKQQEQDDSGQRVNE